MFTIKICNQGQSIYYETDAIDLESVEGGYCVLKFSAQNDERRIFFRGVADHRIGFPPDVAFAERAYIMNGEGKTIDVVK